MGRRPSWYAYLAALLHIAFSAQVHEAEGIQCWPFKGGPSAWASRACPPLVTVPPFVPRVHRASTAGADPCQDRACTAMLASHPGLHVQLTFEWRVFARWRNLRAPWKLIQGDDIPDGKQHTAMVFRLCR